MKIYVANLSYTTTNDSLQNLFMPFGEVASALVITDRESGQSRGFAFVEMLDDNEGQQAITRLNDSNFDGKTITVSVARPRTERTDNRYGSRSTNSDNRHFSNSGDRSFNRW